MREDNQLKTILTIIEQYTLDAPLSSFMRGFYHRHPQMGSRDRKQASEFVYNYFRVGRALDSLTVAERLTAAGFLCSSVTTPLLEHCLQTHLPVLSKEDVLLGVDEKAELLKGVVPGFSIEAIAPFTEHISSEIDRRQYCRSFLSKPRLWIRVRKGYVERVEEELKEKGIAFEKDAAHPLAFSFQNTTALSVLETYQKGCFEIQDISSQQTLDGISRGRNDYWWDACAGSGGKSLMLIDAEPTVRIYATDKRPTIISNLKERFRKVKFKNYRAEVVDLADSPTLPDMGVFSGIIVDVPCTGSGTWARTPEWLTKFRDSELHNYQALQRKIVQNLVVFLQPEAYLVYITCSVFRQENEENVEYFATDLSLKVVAKRYINGIEKGADTLFVALLMKK